jgi:hypothetical protein
MSGEVFLNEFAPLGRDQGFTHLEVDRKSSIERI